MDQKTSKLFPMLKIVIIWQFWSYGGSHKNLHFTKICAFSLSTLTTLHCAIAHFLWFEEILKRIKLKKGNTFCKKSLKITEETWRLRVVMEVLTWNWYMILLYSRNRKKKKGFWKLRELVKTLWISGQIIIIINIAQF